MAVWLAGAAYCHGYDRLFVGADKWNGSLTWSAVAILPWFVLFEWAKQPASGPRIAWHPAALLALLAAVALVSAAVEDLLHVPSGPLAPRLGLLLLHRLPAAVLTFLMIGLARASVQKVTKVAATADLESIAEAIDWVAAANNYVELHILGRVTLMRMTLDEASRALEQYGFVRVHRRFLVNRTKIVRARGLMIEMCCGAMLPVGHVFAPNLRSTSDPGVPE